MASEELKLSATERWAMYEKCRSRLIVVVNMLDRQIESLTKVDRLSAEEAKLEAYKRSQELVRGGISAVLAGCEEISDEKHEAHLHASESLAIVLQLQIFCITATILGGTEENKWLENDEIRLQRALLEHITRACKEPLFERELAEMSVSPNK